MSVRPHLAFLGLPLPAPATQTPTRHPFSLQHAILARSADEPHTYLVNDISDPLQRSLTSLQLADVLAGGGGPGAASAVGHGPGRGPTLGQCRERMYKEGEVFDEGHLRCGVNIHLSGDVV